MRMMEATIGVSPVLCFVGPPPTLNLFDTPGLDLGLTGTRPGLDRH